MGCSTKKNTPASRAYHNLTSHYNVYFNAKESVKAGLIRINQVIPNDYTHTLPIYKSMLPEGGGAATSEMDLAITKCNKLISLHSITKSPIRKTNILEQYKKFASKGEYNKWVDKSYILMGQASYYKHDYHRAIENYNFVIRKFADQPTRYDAFLGMAKCYIEIGDNAQVADIFNTLSRDAGFPPRLIQDFNLAQAHYHLKNNEADLAIPFLKIALSSAMPRPEKLRLTYVLAQLLSITNQSSEAAAQYLRLLKKRPPYQMAFNARIARMEIIGGDDKDVERELEKMLNDELNLEYRDRIYYARANIALKQGRRQDAIQDLQSSVRYSAANPKQRALSSLDVARILFEDNNYLKSSCYYDTAVAVIDNTYPGYGEIMIRASSLNRLAKDLNMVNREDSLQKIARLSETDRNSLINKIIADIQKEEARQLAEANAAKSDQNYFRSQQFRQQQGIGNSTNQSLWYFYNPMTVGMGKSDFQRIWGKRKLEDNWRRKNKLTLVDAGAEQEEDSLVNKDDVKKKIVDPKTPAFYLQDLPLTDSLMQVSDEMIKSALFSAGRIYRTEFNDLPRSIHVLEELNRRFKGSIYELPAFFELYQLYKENGDPTTSDSYKQQIVTLYPDSKYAKYLLNPNFFVELEERNKEIEKKYGETLRLFRAYNYSNAGEKASETLLMNPDSTLLAKVKFIEVVAKGSAQERTAFSSSLDQYIKSFPNKKTTAIAQQIKELIGANALSDYQQLLAKGYIKEEIVNEELKNGTDHSNDEFGGKYSYDENLFHYYVIVFSKESKVDISRLIYDIANYNLDYYTSTDFDIEPVVLDPKTQMIIVRSFPNKEEGLIYFRSIIRKRAVFQSLKGLEYVNFITSSSNYRTIIEAKDYHSYLPFFTKNYNPYISSNIPVDQLPNPQELLAKIRKEEDVVTKGKFVLLQPTANTDSTKAAVVKPVEYSGSYSQKPSASYCYSVIFLKNQVADKKLIEAFETFNKSNYGSPSIKVTTESLDEKRGILVVTGLGERNSAEAYMKRSVSDQLLVVAFKGLNIRTIVISSENLKTFRKEKNVIQYLEFYNQMK
jgi:tetratricopeptide (TPR) repeat protein